METSLTKSFLRNLNLLITQSISTLRTDGAIGTTSTGHGTGGTTHGDGTATTDITDTGATILTTPAITGAIHSSTITGMTTFSTISAHTTILGGHTGIQADTIIRKDITDTTGTLILTDTIRVEAITMVVQSTVSAGKSPANV